MTTLLDTRINTGDVLVASWGYDQTNVDFYQVVERTAHMVKLQPIVCAIAEMTGSLSETVVPVLEPRSRTYTIRDEDGIWTGETTVVEPTIRRKVQAGAYDEYVKINDFIYASKWDGRPKHQSHTH